ncbi:hypothetical protein [Pedobacter frigoris]|uniref:Uncharacterized protein n=1 Tax=Pedobacter frigoris TaxID=2571272 RepID=A0A4U1CHH3_9SPHI|nr:hypothetical protein [Pedobacter frigoris]TKC06224.1 hypothetical protein FA047_12950 [Pedobacter frigoris]
MNYIFIAVIAFYGIWFLGTICHQFDYKWVAGIRKFDYFRILPRWTFFAPNPGTTDYHLLYRHMDKNDQVSDFKEIPLHDRHASSFIWNASKRSKKVLFDLVQEMNRICNREDVNEAAVKLSFSYICILNFLTKIPKAQDTKSIQFAIVASSGFIEYGEPTLTFCSDFHHV